MIIKRSILYSAYGDYQYNRSMKGAVVCEHYSQGRTSRPFTGYNHGMRVRGLEVVALWWAGKGEEISDITIAWGRSLAWRREILRIGVTWLILFFVGKSRIAGERRAAGEVW
jgi:hypothetical protein